MTCEKYSDRWTDYIFRELPEETLRAMREHLEGCAACRAEVGALKGAVGAIKEGLSLPAADEAFVRDTVAKARALEEERRRPPFWLWAPAAAAVVVGLFLYGMFHLEFADARSKVAQKVEERNEGLRDEALAPLAPEASSAAQAAGGRRQAADGREPFLEEDKALGGVAVPTADAEVARKRSDGSEAAGAGKDENLPPILQAPAPGAAPAPDGAKAAENRLNETAGSALQARPAMDAVAPRDERTKGVREAQEALAAPTVGGAPGLSKAEESKKTDPRREGEKEKRREPSEAAPAPSVAHNAASARPAHEWAVQPPSSYDSARTSLGQGLLPPPETIREEDFAGRFPPPYSEEVRRLAILLARALQGGNKTSIADYRELLKEAKSVKSMLETDEEGLRLMRMIEKAAEIREHANSAAGTGQ